MHYERNELPSAPSQAKPLFKRAHLLFILLAYLVLTIIYTYPLILEFQSAVPMDRTGYGDEFIFIWNIFWTKQALVNFQNPFFTDYIYFPHGTNLAFHSFAFLYSLAAAILFIFGRGKISLFGSYNALIFWSFISAAFFMYLLARQLKASRKAAFCAGIIFSFSTIHFSMIPRLHYLSIELLPLLFLFYYRWHERHEKTDLILLAFSSAILLYNSQIYFLIIAAILALDSIGKILQQNIAPKELVRGYCMAGAIFLLLSAPIVVALAQDLTTSASVPDVSFPFYPATDIANYLFPSPQHIVFPSMDLPFGNVASTKFFGDVFLTWSLCIGLACSLVFIKKRKNLFWIILAVVSFVLSLGHSLHFFGRSVTGFPLPFAWLQSLFPFLKTFRYPMGFSVFLLLAISVLFAKGADAFWEKTETFSISRSGVAPFLLVFFIFLEGLKVPLPVNHPRLPSLYQYLAADHADCGIMELPFLSVPLSREALYYQTFHQKKLVEVATHSAVFPRSRSATTQLVLGTPFYKFAESPEAFAVLERKLQDQYAREDNDFFQRNHIKYLLVHMKYIETRAQEPLLSFIRYHHPSKEIQDSNIYLFQLYN